MFNLNINIIHYLILVIFLFARLVTNSDVNIECYDCTTGNGNITLINSYKVADCVRNDNNLKTEKVLAQIVQKDPIREIIVYACKVEHQRQYYHCSWFDDLQMVPNSMTSEFLDIGAVECKNAIDNGKLKLPNNVEFSDLMKNKIRTYSSHDIGYVGEKGSCSGVDVSVNGRNYRKVISSDIYTISTKMVNVKYQVATGVFMLSNEFFEAKARRGFNTELGYLYWNYNDLGACSDENYKLLYNGETERYQLSSGYAWVINNTDQAFAVESDKAGVECGRNVYYLKNKDIMIVEYSLANLLNKFNGGVNDLNDVDITIDLYSKILYLDKHILKQMQSLSAYLDKSFCEIRRQNLIRLLQSTKYDPETFAYNLYGERGFIGENRGNLIYLTKCRTTSCSLRSTARCYEDIPVTYNNKSVFVHPLTRNIKEFSEEYLCTPLASTSYYIDGEWIRTNPYLEIMPISPIVLDPNNNNTWSYQSLQAYNKKGLYSEEQISQYRQYLVTRSSEKAIRHNLARGMLGVEIETSNLHFDRVVDDRLINKTWVRVGDWLWGKFTTLGIFTSGVLGLWILAQIIIKLLEIIVNCFVIYRQHGLSMRLLASLTNITTRLATATGDNKLNFRNLVKFRRRQNQQADAPLDEVSYDKQDMRETTPSLYPHLERK